MSYKGPDGAVAKDRHPGLKPARMKPRTAAKYLDTSYDTVLKLIHRGVFTVFDNGRRGRGRHIHVLTEELDIFANGGEAAVAEHRAKKKRAKR